MTEPNFFVLGAPKCGTTSLARWLGEHPSVYMSPMKEPHYFSTDLANRSITSWRRYQRLFEGAGLEHLAIGEASTWYLFSKEAVSAIERVYSDVRYIVMTRDPVAMAHSLYHHNLRVLHEDQPSFEKAWALQEKRAAGYCIPRTCTEPAFLQYKSVCCLGSLLHRLYTHIEKSRVLHIVLEDLQNDPTGEYQRVQDFLQIPYEERTVFPAANEARGYRSRTLQRLLRLGGRLRNAAGIQRGFGVAKLNEREQPKVPLSDSFRQQLEDAFSDERDRLEAFRASSPGVAGERRKPSSYSRRSAPVQPR